MAIQKSTREEILESIPRLVAELSQILGDDVKKSQAAATSLRLIACNEGKWESDTRIVIMQSGAIPVLIDLLGMPVAMEHAALTLQCLLGTSDPTHPCKDAVFVFGTENATPPAFIFSRRPRRMVSLLWLSCNAGVCGTRSRFSSRCSVASYLGSLC